VEQVLRESNVVAHFGVETRVLVRRAERYGYGYGNLERVRILRPRIEKFYRIGMGVSLL
jgi:hypothetical protein